jgi:hypothetical protein
MAMTPIAVTVAEMDTIKMMALPLPPWQRDEFFQAVAIALQAHRELGPGLVHRVAAEEQRRILRGPVAACDATPRHAEPVGG